MSVFKSVFDHCDKCGTKIDPDSKLCPKCGHIREKGEERSLDYPTGYLTFQTGLHNFLVGLFGFQILGFLVSQIIISILKIDNNSTDQEIAFYSTLSNLITYLTIFVELIIYNVIKNGSALWKEFKYYKSYFLGFSGFIILFIVSFAVARVMSLIPVGTNDNEASIEAIMNYYPGLMGVSVVLLAPFVEEMTYRVGIFNLFRKKYKFLAYITSILIFAAIHINFINPTSWTAELVALPQYLAAGTVLALIYGRFGFSVSFIAHAFYNLFNLILMLYI